MQYEENTIYNKEIINEAAFIYWKKTFASTFIISIACVLLSFILIYFLNFKSWISGTFLAISIISSVIFLWAFFIFRNRSLKIYEQMGSPSAKWIFNESNVIIESNTGKSEIKWKMFKNIIKSQNVWLLTYKNGSYSTFPLAGVSNETLNFIDEKILEQNGKNT